MLGTLPSSLSFSLTVARAAARRDLVATNRVRFVLTARCTGNVREADGAETEGTGAGLMAGGGGAGTLAALPMPLGSLTAPLSPRAFAGPGGMPLTPASWAGDLPGAARRQSTATLINTVPRKRRPEDKVETRCAGCIDRDPLLTELPLQEQLQSTGQSSPAPYSPSCRLALVKPG